MAKFYVRNTRAAKVTPTQVIEIRQLYADGWTQGKLCREFDLSLVQIGRIVRNESWRQLPETPKGSEELRKEGMQLFEQLKREGFVKDETVLPPPDPFDLPEPTGGEDALEQFSEEIKRIRDALLGKGDSLLEELEK